MLILSRGESPLEAGSHSLAHACSDCSELQIGELALNFHSPQVRLAGFFVSAAPWAHPPTSEKDGQPMGAAPHMPGASALHAPALTNPSSPALAAPEWHDGA